MALKGTAESDYSVVCETEEAVCSHNGEPQGGKHLSPIWAALECERLQGASVKDSAAGRNHSATGAGGGGESCKRLKMGLTDLAHLGRICLQNWAFAFTRQSSFSCPRKPSASPAVCLVPCPVKAKYLFKRDTTCSCWERYFWERCSVR